MKYNREFNSLSIDGAINIIQVNHCPPPAYRVLSPTLFLFLTFTPLSSV